MKTKNEYKHTALGGWMITDQILPALNTEVYAIYLFLGCFVMGGVVRGVAGWKKIATPSGLSDGVKTSKHRVVLVEPTQIHPPYFWRYDEPDEKDLDALMYFRNAR